MTNFPPIHSKEKLHSTFLLTLQLFKDRHRFKLKDHLIEVVSAGHTNFVAKEGFLYNEKCPHSHDNLLEFHLIIRGRGFVALEENEWVKLYAGDMYWVLPGERHMNRIDNVKKGYELLHYGLRLSKSDSLEPVDITSFLKQFGLNGPRIVRQCSDLIDTLSLLEKNLQSPMAFSKELSENLVKKFFYLNFQKMSLPEEESKNTSDYLLISQLHNKISHDLSRHWTLQSLSEISGYSERHLSRIWKQVTEFSPLEFINRVRLEHARRLLIRSDHPLEQIAMDSGFSSCPYFSRSFKKITGVTPDFYRKNFQTLSSSLCWRTLESNS